MKTQIITEEVLIRKAYQTIHFELRIPDNTYKLTAVSFGVRFNQAIDYGNPVFTNEKLLRSCTIADVRLRGAEGPDWFYATTIRDSLFQVEILDYYRESSEMELPFMFHGKHQAHNLEIIPATTRVKGFVKDCIGGLLGAHIHYTINISLQIELTT